MQKKIITFENVVKKYGDLIAVDKVSFEVNESEMFGFVGPDGAGKTTIIKLLVGLLKQDVGKINIIDYSLPTEKDKIKQHIGYLPQKFSLYTDLTVDENIEFFAEIHGVTNFERKRDFLLEFSRLHSFRSTLVGNLSGGMKQKLALICTLIYDPKILLLDEPTTGVDPVSRREFWLLLNHLVSKGLTIVLTSPYLDEAERCHRVALINKGKILACDKPETLLENYKYSVVEILCEPINRVNEILNAYAKEIQIFGDRLNVVFDKQFTDTNSIINILEKENIYVRSIQEISPRLENLFITLLKERLNE